MVNIKESIKNNIHIREFLPSNISKVLITVHGFAGDKESSVIIRLGEELAKHNIAVISFDLPCHGSDLNDKPINLKECFSYLEKIIDYAKKEYDLPISLFATSFGGFLTLNYLKNNSYEFDKIILRAPAINMDKILADVIIPEHGFVLKDLENIINLGYEKPLLVGQKFYDDLVETNLNNFIDEHNNYFLIQGMKDNVVNPNYAIEFCNNNLKHCEIFKFENADHRFKNDGELEKIVEITKNILDSI